MWIAIIFRLVLLGCLGGLGGGLGGGTASAAIPITTLSDEVISNARVAQVRLAELLANADAIHSVRTHGRTIVFAVSQGDTALDVTATTNRKGEVIALVIAPAHDRSYELGGLSWLSDELASVSAITRLAADEDGAVTLTTSDGRRYMAIPGRGSGGNDAVEARWAAEWNTDGVRDARDTRVR
ncbi:MAG TPA: hypothetical protein VFQ53_19310 [Kofleriaceae bacterium]|nr:hypothetical protein [Kofleriaceae bacterium]